MKPSTEKPGSISDTVKPKRKRRLSKSSMEEAYVKPNTEKTRPIYETVKPKRKRQPSKSSMENTESENSTTVTSPDNSDWAVKKPRNHHSTGKQEYRAMGEVQNNGVQPKKPNMKYLDGQDGVKNEGKNALSSSTNGSPLVSINDKENPGVNSILKSKEFPSMPRGFPSPMI